MFYWKIIINIWQIIAPRRAHAAVLAAFVFICSFMPGSLAQQGTPLLQGTVKEQNYLNPGKVPGLNSGDLRQAPDPFGKGDSSLPSVGPAFEPPDNAFNFGNPPASPPAGQLNPGVPGLDPNAPAGNQPPFNLNAQEEGASLQPGKADPDSAPALQLAWDQWHKRVAAAIYERFNAMAQFAFRYSTPLACYVTYTITRDGRIVNAQLQQKSPNIAFNVLVLAVINSMSGQTDILAFPPGSQRQSVSKAGMFTQNYGVEGFKYTTGDKETIPSK